MAGELKMRFLLRLCAAAALLAIGWAALIGATPSFVRLSTPILIPSSYQVLSPNVLSSWTGTTLGADTHRVAVIFKVPARGFTPDTITLFGVYARVIATIIGTDSSLLCTLYNVKNGVPELAPGVPGKPYHPSTPHGGSAVTYSAPEGIVYVGFTTAAVCTAGQTIAAIFCRAGGGGSSLYIYRTMSSVNAANQLFPYCAIRLASASWTRLAAVPGFGLKYSDYATRSSYLDAGMPVDVIGSITVATPKEYGNRLNFPFPMKVIGAWAALQIGDAPYNFEIKLYDTTGTNGTQIAAATFGDTINTASGSETSTKYLYWGGEITLNANQTYRLVIAPKTTAGYVWAMTYSFKDSTSKIYGAGITYTARDSVTTTWTDNALKVVPHMGLIVSQLSAGVEDTGIQWGKRRRIQLSENGTTDEDIGPWISPGRAGAR
jgi:hypothetical protein